jgi:SAM-dependent methyltransferase
MDLFFEIHKDLPREGPGDDASTLKAFSLMKNVGAQPAILDIACGPGMQTLALARGTKANITAIDTHQPFLDECTRRAKAEGLQERIHVYNMSMFEMDFPEHFDVIWSEGAVYIIGFERGLLEWGEWLKPGGYIAVTEISWLKPSPPLELLTFWQAAYPGMSTVEKNLEIIRTAGYHLEEHFSIPTAAWLENYYGPVEARLAMLRRKYAKNADALKVITDEQLEIDLFRKYSDWYGYEFYVMRKV